MPPSQFDFKAHLFDEFRFEDDYATVLQEVTKAMRRPDDHQAFLDFSDDVKAMKDPA